MRVKQEFKICYSPFFAWTLLECISLGDVKRARSTSFRELPVLKSEDPELEIESRLVRLISTK